jgi:FdhE protein
MNLKRRQDAIAEYRARSGEMDWNALMDHAEAVLAARDRVEEQIPRAEFDAAKAREAVDTATPYLKLVPRRIDAADFRRFAAEILTSFTDKDIIQREHLDALGAVDWSRLTDETIAWAGINPDKFFINAIRELLGETPEEMAEVVLAGVLINVVRAYLDSVGEDMSEFLAREDEVTYEERPLRCPTCGQPASLSSVLEGSDKAGSARRLFCACCGTVWPFERIRCAGCGTRNSNQLEYVYANEDPAHRLHVCSACGGAVPTVFQEALKGTLDFDVEQTASGIVESLWIEQQSEEQA